MPSARFDAPRHSAVNSFASKRPRRFIASRRWCNRSARCCNMANPTTSKLITSKNAPKSFLPRFFPFPDISLINNSNTKPLMTVTVTTDCPVKSSKLWDPCRKGRTCATNIKHNKLMKQLAIIRFSALFRFTPSSIPVIASRYPKSNVSNHHRDGLYGFSMSPGALPVSRICSCCWCFNFNIAIGTNPT